MERSGRCWPQSVADARAGLAGDDGVLRLGGVDDQVPDGHLQASGKREQGRVPGVPPADLDVLDGSGRQAARFSEGFLADPRPPPDLADAATEGLQARVDRWRHRLTGSVSLLRHHEQLCGNPCLISETNGGRRCGLVLWLWPSRGLSA